MMGLRWPLGRFFSISFQINAAAPLKILSLSSTTLRHFKVTNLEWTDL